MQKQAAQSDVPNDLSLASLQRRHGPRYRWWLLLSVMTGSVAAIMSSTILNVAIPDMSRHFVLGQERAQWVNSGFMMAQTLSMLTTPWLLSRLGYRRTYQATMLLLLAGGVMGGMASDYPLVLAARVAEGLAAGVVQPIPAIVIMRAFEPERQGSANGIFGLGVVLAPALGPAVGGVLVDVFGWRSIFFMVVPFCLVALWMAARYVPLHAPGAPAAAHERDRLDWPGLLLAGGATLCLLNGFVALQQSGAGMATWLLAGAALMLVAFVGWQRLLERRQRQPLMSLAVFGTPVFAMGSVVAFIYGMALFGSTYLVPAYMQMGLGLSASSIGVIFLPAGVMLGLTIAIVGRLADRHPTWWFVMAGLALLALSFVLMTRTGPGSALWALALWVVVGRVGLGFILPSLSLGSLRSLPQGQIPQGASTISFMRMLGGSIGVSLCGIFLEWRASVQGDSLAQPAANAQVLAARLLAFDQTFLMLAALSVLALVAAWRMGRSHRSA